MSSNTMDMLRIFTLYAVPVASMAIFAYYTRRAGSGDPGGWGSRHGVHADLVRNYRLINTISLLAWIVTFAAVLTSAPRLAQNAACFAVGYLLCDVVFYLPMARIAQERFPFDQFLIVIVEAVYAVFLPFLMTGAPTNSVH